MSLRDVARARTLHLVHCTCMRCKTWHTNWCQSNKSWKRSDPAVDRSRTEPRTGPLLTQVFIQVMRGWQGNLFQSLHMRCMPQI